MGITPLSRGKEGGEGGGGEREPMQFQNDTEKEEWEEEQKVQHTLYHMYTQVQLYMYKCILYMYTYMCMYVITDIYINGVVDITSFRGSTSEIRIVWEVEPGNKAIVDTHPGPQYIAPSGGILVRMVVKL